MQGAIWNIIELEDIIVLNNVIKFHKILIRTIRLRERTSLMWRTYRRTDRGKINDPAIVMTGA